MAAMKKGETVPVNLGALLDAGVGAVVTLVAGNTQLVVHRAVLSARSPAFAAMFGRRRNGSGSWQVTISDVGGPVLRELVSYLYTLQAPQLPDMVPQLLAAADQYGVWGLKADCERQMVACLTIENAAAAAVLAVRHNCLDLKQAAVTFIKAHTHQVMATQGWADAMFNRPRDLLEVSRLFADVPVESGPTGGTQGQPQSSHSKAPEAAAALTTSPSGGAPGSQARSTGSTDGQSQSSHNKAPQAAAVLTTSPSGGASGCQAQFTGGTQYHSNNSMANAMQMSPSGGNSGCQLWNLSAEEKGRRLIKAAEEGKVNQLEKLLAAGADVKARDENECTALHIAARDGLVGVVKSLLRSGAELEAKDHWVFTPLHWAAQSNQVEVVRVLVEASANLDARDMYGCTPLHSAAYFGNEETAAALLQAGADWMARDDSGNLPLDLARNSGNRELVEMLYCYSYDPDDFS